MKTSAAADESGLPTVLEPETMDDVLNLLSAPMEPDAIGESDGDGAEEHDEESEEEEPTHEQKQLLSYLAGVQAEADATADPWSCSPSAPSKPANSPYRDILRQAGYLPPSTSATLPRSSPSPQPSAQPRDPPAQANKADTCSYSQCEKTQSEGRKFMACRLGCKEVTYCSWKCLALGWSNDNHKVCCVAFRFGLNEFLCFFFFFLFLLSLTLSFLPHIHFSISIFLLTVLNRPLLVCIIFICCCHDF